MVPLRQTTREELMRKLCAVHARRGTDYSVGLGFYAFLRFHVDTTKYRRWGADPNVASCPAIIKPSDLASVTMVPQTQPTAEPATTIGAKVVYAPHATDPLAPTPVSTDTQP
jgi:hypothetical protein